MELLHPTKTHEIHNHHVDSTIWNDFNFRDDDIVVATYPKNGTTWTQQIVAQLLAAGDPSAKLDSAYWLDARFSSPEEKLARFEAQIHRRSIKTHLPLAALHFSSRAKYIFVARDGRDAAWSLHHHIRHMSDELLAMLNDAQGLVGPPLKRPTDDVRSFFLEWLDQDGFPFWSFWETIAGWWAARELPNVKLVHFNALKRDLPGNIRAIADFLAIDIEESRWEDIIHHCSFDYMKAQAPQLLPACEKFFIGGARSFINKGTNGRWTDILSADDNQRYLEAAHGALEPACAHWLTTGDMPDAN